MHRARGYSTLEKIKEEYKQNRARNIERKRRLNLKCFKNCKMRCERCWDEIDDCKKCSGSTSLLSELSDFADWYLSANLTCHICKVELPRSWHFCGVCDTDKKNEGCPENHGGKKSMLCACELPCCGKLCSACIQDKEPRSECGRCGAKYCQRHAHKASLCLSEKCPVSFCPEQVSYSGYCSEACRISSSKHCSCCGSFSLPEYMTEGACDGCLQKHGNNFKYRRCEKCNKFGECKYYRQRNKISQGLTSLCEICKKEEIKKCFSCGCCLILFKKEFKINGNPVKKAYFFYEKGDEVRYVCSRPKCVWSYSYRDLKEPS